MHQSGKSVPAGQLQAVTWQKSRRSNPSGNCVELAQLPDGAGIAVRNSRDPLGPALIYTPEEMAAFILGARDGDFDHLVGERAPARARAPHNDQGTGSPDRPYVD
jgi:hypothetical protein